MNKETEEDYNPYCEVCGTCGYIGCCGIRNFIDEHIEGKTNCKNEEVIISELIDLCDYKDRVFEENKQLQQRIDKANNELITVIQIIIEQPSDDPINDKWLFDRLEAISSILGGNGDN